MNNSPRSQYFLETPLNLDAHPNQAKENDTETPMDRYLFPLTQTSTRAETNN